MSEKTTKTKAELLEILAQAVRNTQPQSTTPTQPEPTRDAQPQPGRKTRPVPNRKIKTKNARASASRKQRRQ
jgi:hypothetical protein